MGLELPNQEYVEWFCGYTIGAKDVLTTRELGQQLAGLEDASRTGQDQDCRVGGPTRPGMTLVK